MNIKTKNIATRKGVVQHNYSIGYGYIKPFSKDIHYVPKLSGCWAGIEDNIFGFCLFDMTHILT